MNQVTLTRTLLLANPDGLHMRPSADFVELAGRFNCNVAITHNGETVNGRSLLDLMLLAAMPGSELTLEVEGPDAPRALETLATFLSTPSPLTTSRSDPRGVLPEFALVQGDSSMPCGNTLARAEDVTAEELRPPAGESRSGLTKADAEGLLDWLEAHSLQGQVLFSEEEPGFAVRW